ncbi:MAG TPA: DUF1697 domain-containing protein [Gemmatimonadaceae bacterium]|nr:DUF1697 domain-containing protein [Gemmatimonadaceae bacterium]
MPKRTTYIALLRAVNVGGTGKLPMSDLKSMCEALGFASVRTYIASGNVIFDVAAAEADVKARIEDRLERYASKRVDVFVRTGEEMRDVARANPFPRLPAKATVAVFLDARPPKSTVDEVTGRADEQLHLGKREIYIAYGAAGMARSKLKLPRTLIGTARNMNTVAALAELALERR